MGRLLSISKFVLKMLADITKFVCSTAELVHKMRRVAIFSEVFTMVLKLTQNNGK